VLVLSGAGSADLPDHAARHGWSFLAKPVHAEALRDAVDRLLDDPTPTGDSAAMTTPSPNVTGGRPRVVMAQPIPVMVQLVDKLGELAAVLAFCYLAYHGKLSGEIAVGASLAALGLQNIPRGILAARTNGAASGAASLGLIGLGLLAAMHAGEPPTTPGDAARVHAETAASALPGLIAVALLGALLVGCGSVGVAEIGGLALVLSLPLAIIALLRRPTRVVVVSAGLAVEDPPHPTTALPPPSGQSGRVDVPALLGLGLLVLAVIGILAAGCIPTREAIVDTQSPRVACAPDTHRCLGLAPQVCSRQGRWWDSMPLTAHGVPRTCADTCEVIDGEARCTSSVVVVPAGQVSP
jgi:hypothetical protein